MTAFSLSQLSRRRSQQGLIPPPQRDWVFSWRVEMKILMGKTEMI